MVHHLMALVGEDRQPEFSTHADMVLKKKGRHQFKYLNKEFNLSNDPSFIIYAEIFIGYPVLSI